jgi:putative transposase
VNRKKVHRIVKLKGWTLPKRKTRSRPRVETNISVAKNPNERWATDLGNIFCGDDGWCVFAPVIDCCTREVLDHALKLTGKAKTVERVLEEAILTRFGTLHSAPEGMLLRHDNGLVFGSRSFRSVAKDYGLRQEPERREDSQPIAAQRVSVARQYITPYTPRQNGLCECFIKTFKEESCWCNRFRSLAEARIALAKFIDHYNNTRPHQAPNYQTPSQRNQDQCKIAA